jgi:hypothetical protein
MTPRRGGWRSHWDRIPLADAGLQSVNDETSSNNDDRKGSTGPRFLDMQSFLGRGGHVRVVVLQNKDEGSRCKSVSVELVLVV